MQRTRASEAAIEYIHIASAINSIPHSMVCAIVGDLLIDTEAP